MNPTVYREDSWIHKEDTILIQTMLEYANKPGSTQQDAFEAAATRLPDRSASACSNRWHAQLKYKVISNPTLAAAEIVENIPDLEEPKIEDYTDAVIAGKNRKPPLILKGLYLTEELVNLLDMLHEMGGRGTMSRIAIEALNKHFRDKGLL